MLFNAGGGANGTDLLLEVTFKPARHGEQLFETLAGDEGRGQHEVVNGGDAACVAANVCVG